MSAAQKLADALAGVHRPTIRQRWNEWVKKDRRYKWGEVALRFGFCLSYSVYEEHGSLAIALGWPTFYIKTPMLFESNIERSYGFTYFSKAIQFEWNEGCFIAHMPWDWTHVRHDYLHPDGSFAYRDDRKKLDAKGRGMDRPFDEDKEAHPYTYVLKNGTVQKRIATINGEEREWRWRWFTMLPFPRTVSRTINVDFDGEVGERSGSWKGGTVGCSYEWRHGETMEQALRRMEQERKF